MKLFSGEQEIRQNMTFKVMSIPAKALSTCIVLTLSFGMIGALGQVVIHDIIPTFQTSTASVEMSMSPTEHKKKRSVTSESIAAPQRGDLFSELSQPVIKTKKTPFYKAEQFVWTLKWTHIHLFGMGMIFHFHGRHQFAAGRQSQASNLADFIAFPGSTNRYFGHVAEGICLAGFFLAAHTRRWRFCRDICLCVPASVVGDVGHIPTTRMILLS
jgi:hypothetical protein